MIPKCAVLGPADDLSGMETLFVLYFIKTACKSYEVLFAFVHQSHIIKDNYKSIYELKINNYIVICLTINNIRYLHVCNFLNDIVLMQKSFCKIFSYLSSMVCEQVQLVTVIISRKHIIILYFNK